MTPAVRWLPHNGAARTAQPVRALRAPPVAPYPGPLQERPRGTPSAIHVDGRSFEESGACTVSVDRQRDAISKSLDDVPVQTVLGEISTADLGMTLTHEHLWSDFSTYAWQPEEAWKRSVSTSKMSAEIAWLLREDPFFVRDNLALNDVDLIVAELSNFSAAGGRSVIEVSNAGMGRNPRQLARIARESGLNIVMGSGWYIEQSHGSDVDSATVNQLADRLIDELTTGADGTKIRPGVIGEIGVSSSIAAGEKKTLAAAAQAYLATKRPVIVHLDGWTRAGHDVLDLLIGEGVPASAAVLGHMNPSGTDPGYQKSLAERGAWLGFDMTGMGYFFASHGGQAPSPDEDAVAIARLCHAGHGGQVLVSHDVFVKSMLARFGGNGFGFVSRLFLPRLVRHGVAPQVATALLTDNPRSLFIAAASS